ncbi:MAG: hypothetical protein JHD00_11845 [Akkermansiaceae bacterium]|nr:hypothetical protein [Akkermansiaceae bacterium]
MPHPRPDDIMEDQTDGDTSIRNEAEIERKAQTLDDRDKTLSPKDTTKSQISKKPSSDSLSAP